MTGEAVLILDADSIAYKAAAANETKSIKTTHKEKGTVEYWDNRTAFRKELELNRYDSEEMYTIEDQQDPRHMSYAQNLVTEMIKGYCLRSGISNTEIYISGKDNFRDKIPLPLKYKGKREDTIRPVQLKALRAWMVQELGAIVVDGMEVDDMSSIRAYQGVQAGQKVVQCTVDKDALQCTGWLFNPDKDSAPYAISGFGELHREGTKVKGTGRMWLYFQSLYGDATDCYHGSTLWKMQDSKRKFGEVAAYNILKDCKNDKEAWEALYKQYIMWYPSPVTYIAEADGNEYTKDAVDILQMYVDCAHMRRWEDDRIDVRSVLTKLGII